MNDSFVFKKICVSSLGPKQLPVKRPLHFFVFTNSKVRLIGEMEK